MSCCCIADDSFLPPLAILCVYGWSYYIYVIELCTKIIKERNKIALYLIFYHVISIMGLWCFFKVLCSDIPIVPKRYKLPTVFYDRIKDLESEQAKSSMLLKFCNKHRLTVVTRNSDGYIRFCRGCKHIKPDRAHHCSDCGTCILKMDHHCPWFNNCISLYNYKYFVLFLFYSSLYFIFYIATSLEYFIYFWRGSSKDFVHIHMAVGFTMAFLLGVFVTSFFAFHMTQVFHNRTTLETLQEPNFSEANQHLTFDLGTCDNLKEVFGEDCCLAFFPVDTNECDGADFPLATKE